jgi:hypothetical protein
VANDDEHNRIVKYCIIWYSHIMKVLPPEIPPYTPRTVEEQAAYEQQLAKELPLLEGSLAAFNGTPAAVIIHEAFDEAGPQPGKYDTQYCNYYGFPTTGPTGFSNEGEGISPIMRKFVEKIESGEVLEKPVSMLTHRINYDSERASLLRSIYDFTTVLVDAETNEVIAYLAGLTSDGGRSGEALLSPKDVVAKEPTTKS